MRDPSEYGIQTTAGGITIKVLVSPRASTNRVMGVQDGATKIALTAPPVEGAANKALVDFLAKALGVPKSNVYLAAGETSRRKLVSVVGIGAETALQKLGL